MQSLSIPLVTLALAATTSRLLPAQTVTIHPFGNYHAHLVSEASAKLLVTPRLPVVELPPDIDRVLRELERSLKAGDPAAIAALFAEDALFPRPTGWVRGRDAVLDAAGDEEPADVRIDAHAVQASDSVAWVAASVSARGDSTGWLLAKLSLDFRRGSDGRWLIAALLREDRPPPSSTSGAPFTAKDLIAQMDSAGIRRSVVLSVAYWFGSALMPGVDRGWSPAEEYAKVRAENDWVASQVGRYPDRLVGFCSVHPLKPYALDELRRCKGAGLRGLKLHLANSRVDTRKPADLEQLRRVFRAANQQRLPIVVHMRPRLKPYGREDVEIFLRQVLPEAPDIPIQIAHLAGWGGYDDAADEAAATFADAIARKDPVTKNLWFDITTIVSDRQPLELRQRIAKRIRQIGLRRVVYGSDLGDPKAGWSSVVRLIPLSKAELAIVAGNVTPYIGARSRR